MIRITDAARAKVGARSPSGVPPRLFGGRTNAPVQLQAHFLGRGSLQALSEAACPSPATWSQTGRHAGRALSRSRPGADRILPPAGAALAPPSPSTLAEGVLLSERDSLSEYPKRGRVSMEM